MKRKTKVILSVLYILFVLFVFSSCNKLKPEQSTKDPTQIEFAFLKNDKCFSKYDFYIDASKTLSFYVPVFANKFIEKSSEVFPIQFVSAAGSFIEDLEIVSKLDWLSCDSSFNSIYVYQCNISAKDTWDPTVKERKITSLKFSYGEVIADFTVDITLASEMVLPYELIDGLSIVRNNTQYVVKSETDSDGKNTYPYPMAFYWECTAWGAEDRFDERHSAYIKAAYFEHSYFDVKNLKLFYHPLDGSGLIEFIIDKPQQFQYKLSQRTDTLTLNVEKTTQAENYLFIGDNLVLDIEYNGEVHKAVVANIQLNSRNSALATVFAI